MNMVWLWVVLILIFIGIGIGISQLRVHIYFSRVKQDDHFFVHVKWLASLVSYKFDVPQVEYRGLSGGLLVRMQSAMRIPREEIQHKQKQQFTPEAVSDIYHWGKVLLAHVKEFTGWLKHMLTHIKCTELRWDTRLGIGDAPETAMAVGLLWAVKSTAFGYLFQYAVLDTKPKVTIQPQYNRTELSTEFSCRAHVRVGFIIYSMLVLLWRIMKSKNGLKTWKNVIFREKKQSLKPSTE